MARRASRGSLGRDAIVTAAIELADEEGVGALTMRKLAGRLGYEVMSLYNHIANKGELLTLMVDSVAAEISTPDEATPALPAVREIAMSFRGVLVEHPWVAELWNRHLPGPDRVGLMETLLATLARSGLSDDIAHHGFHAVSNHVLGYTLQELGMPIEHRDAATAHDAARAFVEGLSPDESPHMIAHVHQHLDGETSSSFQLVLDLILDGLVRLDETSQ